MDLEQRAARHAALSDPVRLQIVDELTISDRAPVELGARLGLPSNLLAHHLDVLEDVAMITRSRSSGDGRRRYVHLLAEALDRVGPATAPVVGDAVFVCTHNSARSQLAAALWRQSTGCTARSAGTHPAERVHPKAVAAGRKAGIDLSGAAPQSIDEVGLGELVVTVCDRAHEELDPPVDWLHWSVLDPVPVNTAAAFDATVAELRHRIGLLAGVAS